MRALFSAQLVAELETLADAWRARLALFSNSVCSPLQHAQTRLRDVLHDRENAVMPGFPLMESVLFGDVDDFDMAAVGFRPVTVIAFNAQLSGTAAASRSWKKHAQRSLWFAVGAPPTVVQRAAAAEHSLFVLYLDGYREPKSLLDQQLHPECALNAHLRRAYLRRLRRTFAAAQEIHVSEWRELELSNVSNLVDVAIGESLYS